MRSSIPTRHRFVYVVAFLLSGCAVSSGVMESDNGTYMINAMAAPVRGGAAGAYNVAYSDAQKFCAAKGLHAVVIGTADRDVYQAASGYGFYGGSG